MDGGRVLRALLARKRSDLSATVLAVHVGRFIGLAMVLAGLRYDLWLSLIGLFVLRERRWRGARRGRAHRQRRPEESKTSWCTIRRRSR